MDRGEVAAMKQKPNGISWCHYTFNPWWGCLEVSPACDNCYARELANRFGWKVWGKDTPRRFFSGNHWAQPLAWNELAKKNGERYRVFCGSMCDVMEERDDLNGERLRLYPLIEATPNLDWLLLTKRPQNFRRFLPLNWLNKPLPNVWLMTTIESPEYYWRWEALRDTPAAVYGVSYEPAIAPISLKDMVLCADQFPDWIICGDESGRKARPSQLEWYDRLQKECAEVGTAFHMKQICMKGEPIDFPMFPEHLQVRAFPEVIR